MFAARAGTWMSTIYLLEASAEKGNARINCSTPPSIAAQDGIEGEREGGRKEERQRSREREIGERGREREGERESGREGERERWGGRERERERELSATNPKLFTLAFPKTRNPT